MYDIIGLLGYRKSGLYVVYYLVIIRPISSNVPTYGWHLMKHAVTGTQVLWGLAVGKVSAQPYLMIP